MSNKILFIPMILSILIMSTFSCTQSSTQPAVQFYKTRIQKQNLGIILKAPFLHQTRKPISSSNGSVTMKYYYAPQGLLSRTEKIEKKTITTSTFIYNNLGQLITITLKDNKYPGQSKWTYHYNSKGQIQLIIFTDEKHRQIYEIQYIYNSNGKLKRSKHISIHKNKRKFFATEDFFYYKNGLLKRRRFHVNVMSYRRKGPLYKYNSSGELISIKGYYDIVTTFQYE